MSVTPKAKVLGLRSRMGKNRRQLVKENTDSANSVYTETGGKTILTEGNCFAYNLQTTSNSNSCLLYTSRCV